ncbi:MAG: hypothetical protein ACOC2L_01655, partial [Candidatus Sumerlaeota bacterium]
ERASPGVLEVFRRQRALLIGRAGAGGDLADRPEAEGGLFAGGRAIDYWLDRHMKRKGKVIWQ